ncbi:hypothetical protein [Streptomyces sp. ST2-7A]|uniref:hypothetical protein n=1 Tax=Streptomyces sp. ST2-7A TaxID=2907214 RepID=UPI001F241A00|nr:hypothetical protein [Streptomyces sp. ST2-7A]MCE7080145.1 hypothetical protein [Streptomyces sp. ST2-7A]
MARIRTIKPEAFASESLAQVSVHAERTFFGLLTQADDQGRFRDQPAVLAGLLWSLRPEHGALEVEDDLTQLAAAGLICRYADDDGKRYLHIVTWRRHQKINRPSGVRHPPCPLHELLQVSPAGSGAVLASGEPSMSAQGGLLDAACVPPGASAMRESAGGNGLPHHSVSRPGGHREPSMTTPGPDRGSGNREQGSLPSGDDGPPADTSAGQLIAEYTASCEHRPPRSVLDRLGRETAKLLAEGITASHVRAGLALHRAKGLHPSTLPSLVHEAMNARPGRLGRPDARPTVPGHRPWTNPANPVAAYAEEL